MNAQLGLGAVISWLDRSVASTIKLRGEGVLGSPQILTLYLPWLDLHATRKEAAVEATPLDVLRQTNDSRASTARAACDRMEGLPI